MINLENICVSVVIPTHNRPSLARRAVACVLAQTHKNIEIIVVDDCSETDLNVHNIVTSFNDNRIQYIRHSTSRGPSATRNTGIELAKGEYIAFLDDDDIWMESKLEKQLHYIKKYPAALCGFFTQYNSFKKRNCPELQINEIKKDRNIAINSGLIVESVFAKKVKYDDNLRVGEDIDFLFRLISYGLKIQYFSQILYFVNVGDHERITTENSNDQSASEERLKFIYKNQHIYGKFWFNYNIASILLRDFKRNKNKTKSLIQTIKRCGVSATTYTIYTRILKGLT